MRVKNSFIPIQLVMGILDDFSTSAKGFQISGDSAMVSRGKYISKTGAYGLEVDDLPFL